MGALSCGSFSTPHLHWVLHRDSTVGGSGTGGSYGGNAVVPEPMDGYEDLVQGMTLISSNSGTVECGDGYCNGGETHASCAEDCPICEPIPALGGVVDETSLCFDRQGSPAYWYEAMSGWEGSALWTHATDAAEADDVGVWNMTFADAGSYTLEVYVEPGFASSELAAYDVSHAAGTSTYVVDQSAVDGWHLLEELSFDAGAAYRVTLADNTGESFDLERVLAFDAIRLTRTDPPAGEGGAGGEGAGGEAPQGGGGADGDLEADAGDGCSCRAQGSRDASGGRWGALLVALALALRARARR